jgi:hypothetical protein
MAKCEHDRERSKCRECNGGSFCPHNIIRGTCSLCEPEQVFRRYEKQAPERQLRFDLTLPQFTEIILRPCTFCGEWGFPRGVDRRDSSKGYESGNVQSCCGPCNKLKSDSPEHQFLGQVLKIARHQEKLKRARVEIGPSVVAP